ncbi:alpha-amylase family glycosyl hydrolase [Cryptosporangium aurantiacum]|uniref:Alpha amylase, catalytic domain n=1 Tax=Cryptosporangium aurantiacum TaxID=134849 RepID=A0A1M7RFQ6_9ACTN|nr:alpha-amylase family glycosyl hydrolase [Cryptosporangium aurantiacum]SHN45117.1 Alpha amylase, catalytic domain [Cryptosporangium aurantiacum]
MTAALVWPAQPVIHEVDTWVWLTELGRRYERPVTLGDVPAEAWDEVTLAGVDAIWLMGVWARSPAGLQIARGNPELAAAFHTALPDLRPDDVVGSPYCVREYTVDHRLGGPDGLAAARAVLAARGVRLVLDYVPNHVAPDHPWVRAHPERFIRGTADDLARAPDAFVAVAGSVLARGRDPFFPPWPDVLQLNAFRPEMRRATADTLLRIGEQCDGVRCDMAMLMLTDVFAATWGERAGPAPAAEFWPEVFGLVREHNPEMLFVAEAYWDREWILQQQGFDFCYDKRLYDRLADGTADGVRGHLRAGIDYQRKLIRFIENHDEPRAASTLPPPERLRAATVAIATLPGATLWHEGQFDGRRVRLPVFLGRRPVEPADPELRRFATELLAAVDGSALRAGTWCLLETTGWPDNQSHQNLLAWTWERGSQRHLVVLNYSGAPAQGRVRMPWADLRSHRWALAPLLDGDRYVRDGDEMVDVGLFVDLPAWGWHVVSVELV